MEKARFKLKWPLIGNAHITEYLEKSIVKDNICGSYIFAGSEDIGKTTAAVYFAQSLLCQNNHKNRSDLPCQTCPSCRYFQVGEESGNSGGREQNNNNIHGDCHIVKREALKKNIPVDHIREFIQILNLSSFLGSYKIGIIRDAEYLSEAAANALLKTLEEPKNKVIIILVTHDIEALLPTILSRGQIMRFYPVKADIIYDYLIKEHKAARSKARHYSRICLGRPALAVKFFEDKEFREEYQKKVNVFLKFFRQDINMRFAAAAELIGPKASGQKAAKEALNIIKAWQGVARDFMLAGLDFSHLIQHQINEDDIKFIGIKLAKHKIIDIAKSLDRGIENIRANVSPRLVIESIAVRI